MIPWQTATQHPNSHMQLSLWGRLLHKSCWHERQESPWCCSTPGSSLKLAGFCVTNIDNPHYHTASTVHVLTLRGCLMAPLTPIHLAPLGLARWIFVWLFHLCQLSLNIFAKHVFHVLVSSSWSSGYVFTTNIQAAPVRINILWFPKTKKHFFSTAQGIGENTAWVKSKFHSTLPTAP